jgi:hypothetical protein
MVMRLGLLLRLRAGAEEGAFDVPPVRELAQRADVSDLVVIEGEDHQAREPADISDLIHPEVEVRQAGQTAD